MEEGAAVIPVVWVCDCEYLSTWLGCLHAYKGLLLVLGLFLAWETRNVSFPALNDSKQIGISVYNVVLCASIAAPLELALAQHNINVSFALAGATINICTSFSLGMLFFPKVRKERSVEGSLACRTSSLFLLLFCGAREGRKAKRRPYVLQVKMVFSEDVSTAFFLFQSRALRATITLQREFFTIKEASMRAVVNICARPNEL